MIEEDANFKNSIRCHIFIIEHKCTKKRLNAVKLDFKCLFVGL